MNSDSLLANIIEIEKNIKLNDLNVRGINYWPIFRTSIINHSITDNQFFDSKPSFSPLCFFKGIVNSYKFFFFKKKLLFFML